MNGMYVQMILGAAMLLSIVVLDASREVLRLENRGGATFVVAMGSHGRVPAASRNAQQERDRRAAAAVTQRTSIQAQAAVVLPGTTDPHAGITAAADPGTGATATRTRSISAIPTAPGRSNGDPTGTITATAPPIDVAIVLAMQSAQVL